MDLGGIIADLNEERRKIDHTIAALHRLLEQRKEPGGGGGTGRRRKTTGRNQEQQSNPVAADSNGELAGRGRVIPFTRVMREA